MRLTKSLLTLMILSMTLLAAEILEEPNLYVSTTGIDESGNGTEAKPFKTIGYAMKQTVPGDTVFVMPGVYNNPGYGNGDKDNGNLAYISNVHGSEGKSIVLMSAVQGEAKLQFDGSGALIFSGVSYIEVNGFEIEGPGAAIDTADARSHRLDTPVLPYYSGRGIAFWGKTGNHHIVIKNNSVHHCPNSGIRANYVDYITIENNTVWQNCWWSPNAESGVVIAQATNIDDLDSIKIIFRNNKVYNNGNYVVYYNPTYGDGDGYGQSGYTEIVDGQGLYITRSNDTYLAGRTLIENNLSVNNGVNGICFHHTDRGIIRNNTVYKNGQFPDRPISGITINGADDVLVYNNIVVGRDDVVLQNYESSTNVSVENNLIWDGTNAFDSGAITADPLFLNPSLDLVTANFTLQESSPAINGGANLPTSSTDIAGEIRIVDDTVDIGAYELQSSSSLTASKVLRQSNVALTSVGNGLRIEVQKPISLSIVTISGRVVHSSKVTSVAVLGQNLSAGVYLLQMRGVDFNRSIKFIKD
jgi:parallel beta-helix repeat protein